VESEVLLTPEQEAELEESFAEIERGEYVDGDDLIRELRRRSAVVTTKSADEEYIPTDEEAAELEAGLDDARRGDARTA
jgi:predicted transcriptional regulator